MTINNNDNDDDCYNNSNINNNFNNISNKNNNIIEGNSEKQQSNDQNINEPQTAPPTALTTIARANFRAQYGITNSTSCKTRRPTARLDTEKETVF